ncbi:MAG: hypothetical protein FWE14_07050 [Lachnospiraceae bacterium]|nr:hypothetical protein [Lachnospiraceae bacterium]
MNKILKKTTSITAILLITSLLIFSLTMAVRANTGGNIGNPEIYKYQIYLIGFNAKPSIIDTSDNQDITNSDGIIWSARTGNTHIATIYSLRESLTLKIGGTGELGPARSDREIQISSDYPFAYFEQGVPFAMFLNPEITGNTRNLNYLFKTAFSGAFSLSLNSASSGNINNDSYSSLTGKFLSRGNAINFSANDEVTFSVRANMSGGNGNSAQWRFGNGSNSRLGYFNWRSFPLPDNPNGAVIDEIIPIDAQTPVIVIHPESITFEMSTGLTHPLSVTANVTDGGTLTYQWYKDGVVLNNAVGSTYDAPITSAGTASYYVEVINTNNNVDGNTTASTISSTATVTVNKAIPESAFVSLTLNCVRGDDISIPFAVSNALDLDEIEFYLLFNSDDFELINACGFTIEPILSANSKPVPGTNVTITEISEGFVSFKVAPDITEQSWSGLINIIKLKAKKSGESSVFCYYE